MQIHLHPIKKFSLFTFLLCRIGLLNWNKSAKIGLWAKYIYSYSKNIRLKPLQPVSP